MGILNILLTTILDSLRRPEPERVWERLVPSMLRAGHHELLQELPAETVLRGAISILGFRV